MGLRTGILLLFFPIFIHFSFSPHFSSKISPQLYRIESSDLIYRITATSCVVGYITSFVLFVLPYICYLFFLSMQSILQFFVIDFSATVQDRRLYCVCKLTMTCCIVGLRTGILMYILHCICPFFFLSSFLSKISL